jgi:hypothetical protein
MLSLGLLLPLAALAQNAGDQVGVNVHLCPDDVLDAVADSGAKWIRIDNNWFQVETSQGSYDFSAIDPVVDGARARGLNVYMTIAYTPAWASTSDTRMDGPNNDVPMPGTYASYVSATVTHFAGRVTHYGMWNEPNITAFWEGTVDQFRTLILEPGSAAVRAACPSCKVLGPELAHLNGYDAWLTPILQQSAASIDILSHHNYGSFAELGWTPFTSDGFINNLDQARIPGITRPSMRDIMIATHTTYLDVWITETGYEESTPLDPTEEMRQATYVRRALEEHFARSWVTNMFIYEIVDAVGSNIDGFGLLRRTSGPDSTWQDNFVQKQSFAELKSFIATHNVLLDAGVPSLDASPLDAAPMDASAPDGSGPDASVLDSASPDAFLLDAETVDAATPLDAGFIADAEIPAVADASLSADVQADAGMASVKPSATPASCGCSDARTPTDGRAWVLLVLLVGLRRACRR